ncbi:radical SAM protein, partial [Candidatus Pacearchaeota archaeon]|nr:radical SAM protein [Candidatus Pacearchaeota archaeon]
MKPKLILTYKCNRSCEFCFQKNINSKNSVISYKDYYAFLSWLKGQGIMTFSALGGEPTVHPDFPRMLSLANSMDFKVDVLTNLLFKPRLIEIFDQNITVCANISPKVDYTNNEWDLLNDNLQALASLGIEVIPSITIYKRNQGVGQVVGFAKKYENIKTA